MRTFRPHWRHSRLSLLLTSRWSACFPRHSNLPPSTSTHQQVRTMFSVGLRRAMGRNGSFALAGGVAAAGAALYGSSCRVAAAEPSLADLEARMASIEQALAGPSAAAVEAKFTQFWPRKIMILFGPP